MPAPTPPSSLAALRERLALAMAVDRADFSRRLDAIAAGKTDPSALARLEADLERSAARRQLRADTAPKPTFPPELPISKVREDVARAIAAHQVVVICGETGSGKSTQLPKILLAMGRGSAGMIGHTQPRRIAARSVAARIAEELHAEAGPRSPVGFKVRFGDETGPQTLIKVMTDGILLAEVQTDPSLEQYDTIIIDEAHERSLNIDFLLGYLKRLLPRRPDLKVIITSATIDPERLSNHFGGPGVAPVILVSGRTYPVEIRYREIQNWEEDDEERNLEHAITDAVDELARAPLPPGDVLVFFPGEREIRLAAEALRKHHPASTEILPLYARLSPAEQMKVFHPHRGIARRVVLATNVAETSLTVPGIRYVVDTGTARISRYSHRTKVQRLPIEPVSQASANQRSGRCGRVAEGVCIRLYSEQDFASRPLFTEPEILRTNLASVILQMKSQRLGRVEDFPFVEPPDSRMIKDGYETLFELGAIDDPDGESELTKIGRDLAKLPVDPRIGRMLLAGRDENALAELLVLVAALSVQDPRDRPMEKQAAADQAHARFRDENSDFLTLLKLWEQYRDTERHQSHGKLRNWCREHFVSFNRMREWEEVYNQLHALTSEMGMKPNARPAEPDAIHRALLAGLLSNVATRTDGFDYQGARGNKAAIFPGSVLFKKNPTWIMAAELVQTTRLYARTVARIKPEWIESLATHVVKRSYSDIHWQEETGQVGAFERVTLYGLNIAARRRVHYGPLAPAAARDVFIHHALVEGEADIVTPFTKHNAELMAEIKTLSAKARRDDLLADVKKRFEFFAARVPATVYSVGTFEKWRREAEAKNPRLLFMSRADLLEEHAPDLSPEQFPERLETDTPLGSSLNLTYALRPGEEDDGVTLTVPLENLAQLEPARADWLVPGMLKEKVLLLLRSLPKSLRVTLDIPAAADDFVAHVPFGDGNLLDALAARIAQTQHVTIPRDAWTTKNIPSHLLLNIRVVDQHGKPLAHGRDLAELQTRLAGRARKALAGIARAQFGREGLTSWDFDDLPERAEITRNGSAIVGFPTLVDHGSSVSLTLADTPEAAARSTHAGLRRLFALACRDELLHRLKALPTYEAMLKHYAPLGPSAEFVADLADLIVDRTFLANQPAIRTREAFEQRLAMQWGRLGSVTIEVGGREGLASKILESRHAIAHRLASGVPRTWADSIADIREHAEYLLPRRFLRLIPLDRLAEMPRYLHAVRLRLEKLREGGSTRESKSLTDLRPYWKKFTHEATRIAAESVHHDDPAEASPAPATHAPSTGKGKSVLPTNRRSVPVLPTAIALAFAEAAAAGRVNPELVEFRWLLEEYRVSLFAQELGTAVKVSPQRLDQQWAKVPASD